VGPQHIDLHLKVSDIVLQDGEAVLVGSFPLYQSLGCSFVIICGH